MSGEFMYINHPEVGRYGLDLDVSLWAEFNKELMVRNWIKAGREFREIPVPKFGAEVDFGTNQERLMADEAIEELVEEGLINRFTYLVEEPC